MFRYYSCIFKINEFKETTARAVLLRKMNIPLSYTIETSNGSYFDYEHLKDVPYTQQRWQVMGSKVGAALAEYLELILVADRNRIDKRSKRREGKKGGSKKSPQKRERASIFSAMENEKIKHLFEEIRQAEEAKEREHVSDDDLSEGSSDGEGEENDLPAAQANYLAQLIKGSKCQSLSRCRMRTRSRPDQQRTTEDNYAPPVEQETLERPPPEDIPEGCSSEEVFARKRAINIRKPVTSKEKIGVCEAEKKVATAKIINFSFCSQSPRGRSRPSEDRGRLALPQKLNFIELVAGKWS